jgi:hypothetical protein
MRDHSYLRVSFYYHLAVFDDFTGPWKYYALIRE